VDEATFLQVVGSARQLGCEHPQGQKTRIHAKRIERHRFQPNNRIGLLFLPSGLLSPQVNQWCSFSASP
jgi:hypothetical protein